MIKVIEASEKHLAIWDDLIERSVNGTIFHLRSFLSYHGSRFAGKERYLMILKGDTPIAQLSFAIEEQNSKLLAKSPYGASYGGIIFQNYPSYKQCKEITNTIIEYLVKNGIQQLTITHPIACCAVYPLETFYFNLLEAGFKSLSRDVSSVVPLKTNDHISNLVSSEARNMARKANNLGIIIKEKGNINDFWSVMDLTFAKHGVNPTHTKNEFLCLMNSLPSRIFVDIAYKDDKPVAGIGYFVINYRVNSSFYLCQDPNYQHLQGLSMLLLKALEESQKEGFDYFDFGTSTVNMKARENIFAFKENYSKIGMFRETFQWKME